MIVDAHAHFVPPKFIELVQRPGLFPSVKVTTSPQGVSFTFAGGQTTRPMSPGMTDSARRKAWMGSCGIDHQVVGTWLDIVGYELPPDEGADWCRLMNRSMLELPHDLDYLTPLACVPLQSGRHAAMVVEEAAAAGFSGVLIGTQPKGVGGVLDDPDLDPFWEAVSGRKLTVFLHPMYSCPDDRLRAYDLVNGVGRIADTTGALSRLIFSGHLSRFPDFNLLVAHGGAALPMVMGRLRWIFGLNPENKRDPDEGFRRLSFDTAVFDVGALKFLCESAGTDRVLLGSDHPFLRKDEDPTQIVKEAPLSERGRKAVLGGNAVRLFRIKCACGGDHSTDMGARRVSAGDARSGRP